MENKVHIKDLINDLYQKRRFTNSTYLSNITNFKPNKETSDTMTMMNRDIIQLHNLISKQPKHKPMSLGEEMKRRVMDNSIKHNRR